jgi:DNA-binding MarR family transcriptional regulator
MPKTKPFSSSFEIYSTLDGGAGIVEISDPLHQNILRHLTEGSLSTTEISVLTGKAQSTLSVHLDNMVSDGLIRSESDPQDSRRKIFTLSAMKLAFSKRANPSGMNYAREILKAGVEKPENFSRAFIKALVMVSESNGLDIGPIMEGLGSDIGGILAPTIESNKLEDIMRRLQEFYEQIDFGEICIYTFIPLTVIIRVEDETPLMQIESRPKFSHGLFKRVLTDVIGKSYEITHSEIFGINNNYFKFVIEQLE